MRRSGKSKAEVEKETGSTIGVYDAAFEVYPSEIFVVIGLSGSGKSTLLRAINRLIEPTEGKVYLDGEYISEMPSKQLRQVRRKKIGMVFQHFGLLPEPDRHRQHLLRAGDPGHLCGRSAARALRRR